MVKMFLFNLRSGYHVIHVDLYLVMDHIVKQSYHGTLIGCPDILQPKWHNFVTERAPLCDEGCFLHVLRCHFDMAVSGETIHEGKYFMLSIFVDQNINM